MVNYRSSNSGKITDRLIEPFSFTHRQVSVWGYEISTATNKLFVWQRAEKIEVLDEPQTNKHRHQTNTTDAFGMSGADNLHLVLELSLRAANLLQEEFPQAAHHLKNKPRAKTFILDIKVKSFEGIGRFVLGLPTDIKVISTKEFIDYLNNKRGYAF